VCSILSAIQKPASLVDLEMTQGDFRFRKFRHRDQSLLKHAMQFTGECRPHWMRKGFLEQMMWDTISDMLAKTGGDRENVSKEYIAKDCETK